MVSHSNKTTNSDLDTLSLAERRLVEQLCDQFEAAWQSGNPPDLVRFINDMDEQVGVTGLLELVVLDSCYRQQTGQQKTPTWADYVAMFPQLQVVAAPDHFDVGNTLNRNIIANRFQPLRTYASGGLGRVTVARDLQVGRDVALKEMHDRFLSRSSFRDRFMREAEITGRLEHPCIVPVYALGTGTNGSPYYAMRLIQGPTLLDAINAFHRGDNGDSQTIEYRGLLSRFVDVCEAVEYAHQNGVIHRDIKPDNIVVGDYGETLLVDWGLARRADHSEDDLPDDTIAELMQTGTRLGTVLGTPAYMSPEQAAGDHESIDHRTDIYALGSTLYHLIVGRAPDPRQNLPDEPSGTNFRFARNNKPLLAISRKAMADHPDDRYTSALELATDVNLAIADQPVDVYPEPWVTRVRRWLQRHKTLAVASAVGMVLLMVGLAGYSSLATVHSNEVMQKNRQLDQMVQQEIELRNEAQRSEKRTSDSMRYLVNALRSPDPNLGGREIKVVDILDQAVRQLDQDFAEDPLGHGKLLSAIGQTYSGLGLHVTAQPLVERSLTIQKEQFGEDHPETLDVSYQLAIVYLELDDPRGDALLTVIVDRSRGVLGEDDPFTLQVTARQAVTRAKSGHAETAIKTLAELQPKYREAFGSDAPETLSFMNDRANVLHLNGDFRLAIRLSKQVYERRCELLGEQALTTIVNGSNYVAHLMNSPNRSEAVVVLESLLPTARASLGDDHPQTLVNMNRLGDLYIQVNDLERGLPLIRESLQRRNRLYGATHNATLVSANSLGNAYLNSGDYKQAAEQLQQVYDTSLERRGPGHKETLTVGNNLATAYKLNGNLDCAIALFRSTLTTQRNVLGDHHPYTIRSMLNLAGALQEDSQFEKAMSVVSEAVTQANVHLGKDHPMTQTCLSIKGMVHMGLQEFEQARSTFQTCLDIRAQKMPEHWLRFNTMSLLGEVLLETGDLEAAEPMLVQGYEGMLSRKQTIIARAMNRLDQARLRLVRFYEARQMPKKANEYRSQN